MTFRRTLAALTAGVLTAGAAAVTLVPGAEATGNDARAFGLTADGSLVSFDLRSPAA